MRSRPTLMTSRDFNSFLQRATPKYGDPGAQSFNL